MLIQSLNLLVEWFPSPPLIGSVDKSITLGHKEVLQSQPGGYHQLTKLTHCSWEEEKETVEIIEQKS